MKKRTLNEYRQTKEYQGSSEGRKYLDDLENTKEKKLKILVKNISKIINWIITTIIIVTIGNF